jgi:spore germination protein YaaH
LPWGASGGSGLYGGPRRSNSYGRLAVLGLIGLGMVLLVFWLAGRMCNTTTCTDYYCPSDRNIAAEDGYEFVSRIFEYNQKKGAVDGNTNLAITAKLTKSVADGQSLTFFRYVDETKNWEPITPAILEPQGKVVTATFTSTPAIMAVMHRTSPGGNTVAYLAHNAPLHKSAVGHVSIIHTIDFKPAADGTVTGELSSIKQDGTFELYPVISANNATKGDVAIVENILATGESRSNHVNQIVNKVNETNVKGVDIAYMDLTVTSRTSFTLFIGELYERLHAQNKQLTLTLPSPIKAQNRIDEGAYDWAELGKRADLIKIAPYRDQATYRLAMPEILQYLADRVTPGKLVLTVSPYATETGGETIQTMSLAAAMAIATRVTVRADADAIVTSSNIKVAGTNIDKDEGLPGVRWSPETATVAFSYKQAQGGGSRTVYLENFFSIGFKLELIRTYKLGGVAVDDASDDAFLGDIWSALVPFITSGTPILLQPNPQDLAPKWKVKDNQGTIEDTGRGSASWFTPAQPGTYTVSLTLSDGVALFENSVDVSVKAKPTTTTPSASPTAAR